MHQARQLLQETAEVFVIWHQVRVSGVAGWMKVSAVLTRSGVEEKEWRELTAKWRQEMVKAAYHRFVDRAKSRCTS